VRGVFDLSFEPDYNFDALSTPNENLLYRMLWMDMRNLEAIGVTQPDLRVGFCYSNKRDESDERPSASAR
jgi:hypothetical protein